MSKSVADAKGLRHTPLDRVIQHALCCSPQECVGFLLGQPDLVEDILPMCNVHPNPTQGFALDSAEVAQVLGAPIVGIYHSHPYASVLPSALDRAGNVCRRWHYWIVDPHGPSWFCAGPEPS